MGRPDRRVRFFAPSAIPKRLSTRLMVVALEWVASVCLALARMSIDIGLGPVLHARSLAIVLVVSGCLFALFVPLNEWLHRRWLLLGIL